MAALEWIVTWGGMQTEREKNPERSPVLPDPLYSFTVDSPD